MEPEPTPTTQLQPCPQCQLSDQVYQVSRIYLQSSERMQYSRETEHPELDRLLETVCPEPSDCAEQDYLVRRFAQVFAPPPAVEGSPSRPHPDMTFIVFFLLLLVMLFPISNTQPEAVPVAVALLLLGLLAYVIGRASILRRYRSGAGRLRSEAAIKRWGQLYFCSRDHLVFHPEENRTVPLEQIQAYLNEL